MNHSKDDRPTTGAPETDGASDPADVEGLPDGATAKSPGYEASRETLEQAEQDTDQKSEQS